MSPRPFCFAAILLLFAVASTCSAQHRSHKGEGVPNWDAYAGYSYVFKAPGGSGGGASGWDASLKMPVLFPILGIKADVSGFNSTSGPDLSTKQMFFLLGPQVSLHISTSTIFVHGMVGSAHLSSSAIPSKSTFAMAVGAGLDAGMSRHLAWRVTGDYYNTHYSSGGDTLNKITNSPTRFSTGPVLRF
jgi:opacity protein-like surface antigen